jgi:X-Pro dipeptidyl-peptidase
VRIYEALKARGVPVQAYYHQGGHGGAPPLALMNRWFTRYLYGVQNGVESDPKAWIVREGADRMNPTSYPDYPNPAASAVTLHLTAGGQTQGGLALTQRAGQGREVLIDDVSFTGASLAAAPQSGNRLIYATPELTEPVHLSGRASVSIRLASSKPAANLSVWLVMLPFGSAGGGGASVITRGWADPQNYRSLSRGEPLQPGQFYQLDFDMQPDDQIVPAGRRIGLMIMSSDRDFTLWPTPGTELTVDLDGTSITLPVVGGAEALRKASGG